MAQKVYGKQLRKGKVFKVDAGKVAKITNRAKYLSEIGFKEACRNNQLTKNSMFQIAEMSLELAKRESSAFEFYACKMEELLSVKDFAKRDTQP